MSADYWMMRAEKEKALAQKCHLRGQVSFHRQQAQRFLDLAFAEARQPRHTA
jgi:hypothetical protein